MATEGEQKSLLGLLPEEVREVVLHHLNAEDRRQAVLVCRSFYKTICYLDRKKTLKLDDKAS